ncbi:glucosamine--fructose-6-phosphate aminotransferase (isomerizing), partial [Reticulomyxa filosa]
NESIVIIEKPQDENDQNISNNLQPLKDEKDESNYLAQISGFKNESELNRIWNLISKNPKFFGLHLKITFKKINDIAQYIMYIGDYENSEDVITACNIVKIYKQQLECKVYNKDVGERVLHSIKRLEYRGYDSAGVATINKTEFSILKLAGKVRDLEINFKKTPLQAVVHNGIIENYADIKQMLISKGYKFDGETDTEVLTKLIHFHLDVGKNPYEATHLAAVEAKGLFAFVAMFLESPNKLIGVKKGLPLAIGIGENEMYFGSDAFALFPFTNKIVYLSDEEIASITPTSYKVYDLNHQEIQKDIKLISIQDAEGKQHFDHYMLKEIYEQPRVIVQCFDKYYDLTTKNLNFNNINIDWNKVNKIFIIACGTSYYAGLIAKNWFEKNCKINVDVDIASEFRLRDTIIDPSSVFIFISQSGETADTLASLKFIKEKGFKTISILNVVESSIGNLSDYILPIHAGMEIGVASTKAFTTQLMVLALLSLDIAHKRGVKNTIDLEKGLLNLHEVSSKVSETLSADDKIKKLSKLLIDSKCFIYIGRGTSYPLSLEGALKIKEISYLPAEGIPAGELKHGSIALIDNNVPVFVIAPYDNAFTKTASNLQEVHARGGKIILLSNHIGCEKLKDFCFKTFEMPECDEYASPLVYCIILQLVAYHFAVLKGCDVDQPRNLAKSVTVE